jgi:hypothetical protein
MGCGNPYLFTIIVNGPVNDNDVIDLNPQSLASCRWQIQSLASVPQLRRSTH